MDREIYKKWKSLTTDHRYLRPLRWNEIKKVILENNLKSALEFGSGVSTMLFNSLGMKVFSFDTNIEYIKFVRSLCPNVSFVLWDNVHLSLNGHFDIALVDGALPRNTQLDLALNHADFIAIDDYAGGLKKAMAPKVSHLKRLNSDNTFMAIFKK